MTEKIPLKIKMRAILKHPFFKLCIYIGFWFSISCLIMCFIGNIFNLNAGEASGFFQGIVTFFSIISGFLYINYERIQQKTERENNIKQNIYKRYRLIKLSIPDLEQIKQSSAYNGKVSDSTTPTRFAACRKILTALRNTFSDENIENVKEIHRKTKVDLIDIGANNEVISLLNSFLNEFNAANHYYQEMLLDIGSDTDLESIERNQPIIYYQADKINAHLKACKIHMDDTLKAIA